MKLAIFLSSMHVGGAQQAFLRLAGGIAERGHDVDLVLANAEGPFLSEVPGSVRVVDLARRRVLKSLPALVRYLRRHRPSVMLSGLDYVNVVAIWARCLAGGPTRLFVSEHSTLSHRVRHTGGRTYAWMPRLAKQFYPRAEAVIAVSQGVANDLAGPIGIARERIKVIYNPIVTDELLQQSKQPLSHEWFAPGQPPVVLSVGRLTAEKDYPTLIRAFARMRQEHPARLLILGEGEERAALEALAKRLDIAGDVNLPGFTPNPYPFMRGAAMFVLSSRFEGLPGVLIEALSCGTTVISTDCPSGPREILQDGKYGRLIPVGDVDSLAHTMATTLKDDPAPPPPESWLAFRQETVVDQYLDILSGAEQPGSPDVPNREGNT